MGDAADVLFHEGKAVGLRCRKCGAIRGLDEKFCKCETAQVNKSINKLHSSVKILLNENGGYADGMRLL